MTLADMNFGVNVLPTINETYSLGSSTKKWDEIYADKINGQAIDALSAVYRYTATIPTTGWTQSGGLYSVTVPVTGIQASDTDGKATPVQSGTESTDVLRRSHFNQITRISAAANSIVVYALAVPTVEIPIRLEVIR